MNPRRSKLSGKGMTVGAMLVLSIGLSWADEIEHSEAPGGIRRRHG
jgi:hypothetical protein